MQFMKYTSLFSLLLLVASLTACGGTSTEDATGASTPSTTGKGGKPARDPNTIDQIPAREILGSKVERHLRYQPEDEVSQYVEKLSDVDGFLFNVSAAIRHQVGLLTPESPSYGTVVVAVNPQGQHRLWYVFENGGPSAPLKAALQAAVAEAPPLIVKKELVVVGFALTLWGYKESPEQAARVTLPEEWNTANKAFSTPQKATKLAQLTWDKAGV
jgi:hypothetical protein